MSYPNNLDRQKWLDYNSQLELVFKNYFEKEFPKLGVIDSTRDKISFLIDLKKQLDNTPIILHRQTLPEDLVPMKNIFCDFYDFLFNSKNPIIYGKSYLALLNDNLDLENNGLLVDSNHLKSYENVFVDYILNKLILNNSVLNKLGQVKTVQKILEEKSLVSEISDAKRTSAPFTRRLLLTILILFSVNAIELQSVHAQEVESSKSNSSSYKSSSIVVNTNKIIIDKTTDSLNTLRSVLSTLIDKKVLQRKKPESRLIFGDVAGYSFELLDRNKNNVVDSVERVNVRFDKNDVTYLISSYNLGTFSGVAFSKTPADSTLQKMTVGEFINSTGIIYAEQHDVILYAKTLSSEELNFFMNKISLDVNDFLK